MAENVLAIVGRAIIPKRVRPDLRLYLLKAGFPDVPYPTFGVLFFVNCLVSYLVYIGYIYPRIKAAGYGALPLGLLSFVSFAAMMFLLLFSTSVVLYFVWNIRIYNRTKELEFLLPDYLALVSTNLKGGMSFENALWNAIKPEFGVLANEVGLVSKRVMTGNQVAEALVDFSLKYDSPTLRRTVQLLVGETESGGRIVETIDRIIHDMKKTEMLKREMAASTVTYMIFIGSLVAVICPVLFALSLQLFTITTGFLTTIAGSASGGSVGGLTVNKPNIDINDFRIFSILAIAIISIFSSAIISIIEKGNIKSGLKYIPMFLVTSNTVYFLATALFGGIFGGIAVG